MSVSNTTKRVKEIRRKTRRKFSSEEKIRIGIATGFCTVGNFTALRHALADMRLMPARVRP